MNNRGLLPRRASGGTQRIADLFGQFDDDVFQGRTDSYLNCAQPQLTDQHNDAVKQLTFALDSPSRSSLEADLEKRRALLDIEIKDRARSFGTEARANVEVARGDLINTLNATGLERR